MPADDARLPSAPATADPFAGGLPALDGARVRLRMPTPADADGILAVFGDPDNLQYWSHGPLPDRAAAAQYVAGIRDGWHGRSLFQWAITVPPADDLVGTVTLFAWDRAHRRAEIGFALRRDLHGQGLAGDAVRAVLAFAFGPMALHRVEADVDPDNASSLGLLARRGFRREGYARERWFTYGTWKHSVLLARLATDPEP